jgi:pimeloyl-ACP methyl ester carboxylesterase
MKTEISLPPKQPQKETQIFIWMSAGILILIFISIAGFIAFRGVLRNKPVAETPSPILAPILTATSSVKPAQSYTPVFETAPCNFEAPQDIQVNCGFVIVPEDRNSEVADTIRIAVAVFKSRSNTPKPDPLLYLQGGPGAKAIEWSVGVYHSVIAPLTSERDFVVFDPRGVGFSQPALECDEFKATYLQDIEGKIPESDKISYYQGALLSCKNRFLAGGANLSTYTSHDIAADARDVLVALGYQQADLYGVSYGTRIAQFIMREHPEIVRSAILDSVVPVEVQLLNQSPEERDSALQILFDDCKSNSNCSSAYPDLESVYNEIVNQLDAQPIKLEVPIDENRKIQQIVDGSTFRDIVLWTLRAPQTIELAPQLIYRSREGDDLNLIFSLALPILTFDSISMGNYISVNCHDQVFAMSTERLDNTIYELCQLWGSNAPIPGENDPVNSEIPTLIFAGKYDPVTPPSFAEQLAEHLPHSYIVEFANQGHAPSTSETSDCPIQIISEFLQDPTTSPDFACVDETKPIEFIVPYDRSNSLAFEPIKIDQYEVNTRIPSGWNEAEFGFYNRNGSFGDITQIGIQRAPVSESEWVTWLSTNFRGNQGLDQPAVKHDQRPANGLTWSIYETGSQGNPVEIAFAKSGTQTLMILLISHKDEHDALYNGVFLQIIDVTTASK